MKALENLRSVLEYLPPTVQRGMGQISESELCHVQEIRLRSNRPVSIVCSGAEKFLHGRGGLALQPEGALCTGTEDIARSFQAVCSYSVYSHEQDLAEGFVTLRGGCRVGICGTAVRQEGKPRTLRYISSLNFRIAGEYPGTAATVWQQIGASGASILVAGTVGSGKTTFLRDWCRLLGNHSRTALIDERGELAGMVRGAAQNDIGLMTDVLDGYSRAAGILTALRVLSPVCIVCDEISTPEDAEAVLQASGCGVRFAASCHAGTVEDLRRRPVMRDLLSAGVFQYCVLLESGGRVKTVRRLATL